MRTIKQPLQRFLFIPAFACFCDGAAAALTRGPYLQVGTSSNVVVRWRTDDLVNTQARYGTNLANLTFSVSDGALQTEHEITLTNLLPDTKYFYEIGTTTEILAGDSSYCFTTAPLPGTSKPTRIWAIGDFGTGFQPQYDVRDAYEDFVGDRPADVWLMLGDNAYYDGFDHEYQAYCFDVYPLQFRQTVVWPAMGNHETAQATHLSDDYAYYRNFTMPRLGEAGGVPSGTEHFYSFDHANIHFVCLDSMTAVFRLPNSAMVQWLISDLADTTQDWIVVYFHHPPYSRGSHNSDADFESIQLRQNILPILESYGADLVLSGHSHSYERSYLLNGHYGLSSTISPGNYINSGDGRTNGAGAYVKPPGAAGANAGTVYVVDGSSGGQGGHGSLDHPAMHYSVLTYGSLIIDITGRRLDAKFVTDSGGVDDSFTIIKEVPPRVNIARLSTNAVLSWPASLLEYQVEGRSDVAVGPWLPVSGTVSNSSAGKSLVVPISLGEKFFRLRSLP